MTIANRLLDRLEGVRKSGSGWIACCPAHADRFASLSVNDGDDGRILAHCFAGCDVSEVLAAVGLTLADLFSTAIRDNSPEGGRVACAASRENSWRAALGVLDYEAGIVLAAAELICRNLQWSHQYARLALAIRRIQSAREVLR
jgi:hypothetical protein